MGLISFNDVQADRRMLAEAIVARQYAAKPELALRYGPAGRAKCVDDTIYNLLYLDSAVALNSPELFREYIAWVKVLFESFKVAAVDLRDNLYRMAEVMDEHGHAAAAAIARQVAGEVEGMAGEEPSTLDHPGVVLPLARDYLDLLLAGDRRRASEMIVKSGVPVRDLYLGVFQPCLREVGRLWQTGRISVAQEHFFTAATQLIMAQLYAQVFDRPDNGLRMMAVCANGELHEVGVRMVADLFEMDGWDTAYVGASTPVAAVVSLIKQRPPNLLAVSVTIGSNLPSAAALIEAVRAEKACDGMKVLVGGYPFNRTPDLWRRIGADGFAADGEAAVREGRRLVAEAVS